MTDYLNYSSNLDDGHSKDCMDLQLVENPDLFYDIKNTIEEIRGNLTTLLKGHIDFARRIDALLDYIDLRLPISNHRLLLSNLVQIQDMIKESDLDEGERAGLWTPFIACYIRVQSVLQERILPLNQRQLLKAGDSIELAVDVTKNRQTGKFILTPEIPKFTFVIQGEDGNRHALFEARFSTAYAKNLPPEFESWLKDGIHYLPLKVISTEGVTAIVDIDMEAFRVRCSLNYSKTGV